MTVTIREIAKHAGVSRGTVDRVLNDRPGVKPEVRDRILEIVNELNYVPNIAAKALAYQKKPVTLGIVMPPKEIVFFELIRSGISSASEELKDLGVRLEYRYVDNKRPEEGAAAIREFVEIGVSGIMFSVMDDELIRESINYAAQKNVPVVTFNSDVEGSKRVCFVGQDLHKSGVVAAGLMNRVLPAEAKVVIVTGNLKFHAHRSRVEGFKQGLEDSGSSLQVERVIEGFDRYEDTFAQLNQTLSDHADISGIYMATGDTDACLGVIKFHRKEGKIRVVCNDMLPSVEQGLRDRIIDFTIVQNPERQGYLSLRLLFDLVFAGKQPETEHYFTETHIYIPESL
ncbi:LacI family DNA-binding transcriptional regulator [Paenibacillus sp. OV219]|uniref:LacI family DNA-binding transcriptional regulator n=1 Tax=Paenibacillus sp. OV219 TaxID=1884377 RepID=UPI0008B5ABAC|nr:LacI family DNA-binding transcriptional regulator [Paenibacillus sp. OV219]SEO87983.1 LacI family transcriptional regulator [Paenibacillus sp. OV219]